MEMLTGNVLERLFHTTLFIVAKSVKRLRKGQKKFPVAGLHRIGHSKYDEKIDEGVEREHVSSCE